MKFIISRTELATLIGKIQGIVPAKPSLPILANVLIEAHNNQIAISATDLTVSMRVYAPAKVLEEGAITLPARKLFPLIRELTAPQVEIHAVSSEVATVTAGASHFKIQGANKAEYPALPELSYEDSFKLSTGVLKEMLSRTAFAIARDESRHVFTGMLLHRFQNQATFIGTDGKRLAKLYTQVEHSLPEPKSYILPLKAVEEVIKTLDVKDEQCKLILMSDKIAIETDTVTLISKLLSGQYPDVSPIIPQKSENSLVLHREELISLLRQVALFTSEEKSSVKFTFEAGTLQLTAANGEVGEGKVSMPVNYSKEKLDIAFNPHYFLDILRHSKDETVQFDVTDSYNPGLITDSSTAHYVLMPMRLEG